MKIVIIDGIFNILWSWIELVKIIDCWVGAVLWVSILLVLYTLDRNIDWLGIISYDCHKTGDDKDSTIIVID